VKVGVSREDPPAVIVAGEAVKLAIEANATTESSDVPCNDPDVAVIVADPGATAVAPPAASIVATAVEELDQVTDEVMSPVPPSV
jgi:hypothetical protein